MRSVVGTPEYSLEYLSFRKGSKTALRICSSATHYRRREREKKIFIKTDESDNFLDFLQLLFISYIINTSSKRERERYRERNREERAR